MSWVTKRGIALPRTTQQLLDATRHRLRAGSYRVHDLGVLEQVEGRHAQEAREVLVSADEEDGHDVGELTVRQATVCGVEVGQAVRQAAGLAGAAGGHVFVHVYADLLPVAGEFLVAGGDHGQVQVGPYGEPGVILEGQAEQPAHALRGDPLREVVLQVGRAAFADHRIQALAGHAFDPVGGQRGPVAAEGFE
ncbi:hypothetical protein [Streptomyces violascens]|uniref:hypothetical protein n=1 Tax=Streptomyces violascens TaxID=67381 RepID=UPI00368EE308